MATLAKADFLTSADLRAWQDAQWSRQRDWIAESSLYRRLWAGRRAPNRLDDLPSLPLSEKAMLRASQRDAPPFGDYLRADPRQAMRVHRTSGTTGEAMNLALSTEDAADTATVGARAQGAAGLGPGHRVVHCLNYQLWMGGFTDHTTLEATGATVIPFGVGNSEKLVRTIRELGVTAISCTPSYPAVLERTIAEHFPDLKPRDLGLDLGLFGGEAGLDDPAFRRRLESVWGFRARNANYGVSDVFCNFAGQCEQQIDLHFIGLDVLWPELIRPETGEALPWAEGATGELVLTHLARVCQPLARFRTGDIVVLTGLDRCACGRQAPRFRVVGRSDDMVVVRGLNVFPTTVAAVLGSFAPLSAEYRIRLAGRGPYDALPIEAELAPGEAGTPALADAVVRAVKREIGVAAAVTLLAPGSLPRTEGKTRRVIREGEGS
ncbi:MAG: phenylacetate--CoA ligase family protein [Alphaproteobacteria bacterium]|nr:phenylacetate--CoA ligase family protein [Alphaproteobacteria bacterium]